MRDLVYKAYHWALSFHEDQKYGIYPYTVHLARVVDVLWEFGFNTDEWLAAGWLHDILEDTMCPYKLLCFEFGWRVCTLVDAVTDGKGSTRRERKAEAYKKMQQMPEATILKLADRIANVRDAIEEGSEYLSMYQDEMSDFRSKLPHLPEADKMWKELEQLLNTESGT